MAGGALILFHAFNQLQSEAGLSITDPLFGRGTDGRMNPPRAAKGRSRVQ